MDCNPSGSSVHGILQARILEWVAFPFSRGSSWPRGWTQVSRIVSRLFTVWATREAPTPAECPIIQAWHHLRGDIASDPLSQGLSPTRPSPPPTSDINPKSRCQLVIDLGFQQSPPGIQLICQNDSQNSEKQPNGRDGQGKVYGRGCLGASHQISMCPPIWELWNHPLRVLGSFHDIDRTDWLIDSWWWTSVPSPSPLAGGEEKACVIESSSSLTTWLSPWHQPPSLSSFQKEPHQHNKRHLCFALLKGNSKGFRKSARMGTKTKYIFLSLSFFGHASWLVGS